MLTEGIILLSLLLAVFYYFKSPRYRHPPGPTPWPVVGNFFNMPRPMFKHAGTTLRKKYGDIISFTFGYRRFVILNSYSVIKEALTGSLAEVTSGRINAPFFMQLTHGKGIVSSEGSIWREHRRFALKVLRDFGFARQGTEDAIHVEIEDLRKKFDAIPGSELETQDLLGRCIANVISVLLFNYRAGYNDDSFTGFMLASQDTLQGNNIGRFIPNAYPFLLKIPGALQFLQSLGIDVLVIKRSMDVTYKFCLTQIAKHRDTIHEITEPRDYLDAFLFEQEKLNKDVNAQAHTFDDFQLMRTLTELFVAGTDTTSNTLRWCILYAALYPDCQRKLYEEVIQQIGTTRLPKMSDRKNLPYLQAYVDEVQRFATLAPFSVQHRATEHIKLRGYDITPDDFILVNLYGVHHDPEFWEEPEVFRPERFLDQNGVYQTKEHLVPFSLGKRSCLGESLARQELFLFLAGIVQLHKIEINKPQNLEEVLIGTAGLVHAPGIHKLKFIRR